MPITFPKIPFFPRHLCVDQDSLQQFAQQRGIPPGLEQRRDDQGQFQSHRDLPVSLRNDD